MHVSVTEFAFRCDLKLSHQHGRDLKLACELGHEPCIELKLNRHIVFELRLEHRQELELIYALLPDYVSQHNHLYQLKKPFSSILDLHLDLFQFMLVDLAEVNL